MASDGVQRLRQAMLVLGLMATMSACAAKQSATAKPTGFFRDYGQLREGSRGSREGEALLVYGSQAPTSARTPRS